MRHTLTILGLFVSCSFEDFDQDGVPRAEDCNDTDPSQGRPVPLHLDGDRDGFGGAEVRVGCPGNAWLVETQEDCNDNDASVHPDAPEIACDGRDNDCDPSTVDGPATSDGLTWPSVQQAIDAARFGAVVELCASRIHEQITVPRRIVLQGSGRERTVIDANGGGSTIHVLSDATIRDLTVTGGKAEAGGGIQIELGTPGTVDLHNVGLRDNEADEGGGLWASGTSVVLVDTIVSGNRASRGGGLHVVVPPGSELRLDHSQILSNQATDGGGVYLDGALRADESSVVGNRANTGGGIWFNGYVASGSLSLTVLENAAATGAGAFGTGEVRGASFALNVADEGGAITSNGPLDLFEVSLEANRAEAGSGGAVLANGPLTLLGGVVSSNEAAETGGGVAARSTISAVGTIFTENRASTGGAASVERYSRFDGARFTENVAETFGGAIFAPCSEAPLEVLASALEHNRAQNGAAMWIGGRSAEIEGTRLSSNAASSTYGAVVQLDLDTCEASSLRVGNGMTWADNTPTDVAAGPTTYAAPAQPFLCAIGSEGANCPQSIP